MTASQAENATATQESISKETLEQLTALVKEKYPDSNPDSLEDLLALLCPLEPECLTCSETTTPTNSFIRAIHDALLTIPK